MNRPFFPATAVAAASLLLAACQATSFEKAPLAAEPGCDPALVGRWNSLEDDGQAGAASEIRLRIDASCLLVVDMRSEGSRRIDETRISIARHEGLAYAWFDANWPLRLGREDYRFPAGDVMLVRWRIDGEELLVWQVADKPLAHAIIDGEVAGETRFADSTLFNRLTGEANPDLLGRSGLFAAEPGRFRRDPEASR
ncbi:hypothetical protein [Arenimonas composti]|uniref:Lipocalin-like domain-containing protein n=1 Tax=Arenimonas composti TR7-09 = DSM 18010 TaxID=1121013 RepID=A0A091BDU1_9GAMM|nr:hypothetical protein [Arenimonas composti]KFN48949.1 hypothetical protein P873_01215 [Arenimonas composti TR7-09 = DSM 18010]